MELRFSPAALEDLQEIRTYICEELQNPNAAKETLSRILDEIAILKQSPYIGTSLSAKVDFETRYRYLVCGKYLAFYVPEEETISIVRVLYGRRDYLRILFDEA